MDPYKEQFFSGEEGAPRLAVKRLTHSIETQLVENTINAPDWYAYDVQNLTPPLTVSLRDTLFAARMARDILWNKETSIKLEDFVSVSQT